MSTTKIAYSSKANLTITLASLSNGSARESTAIDNTSNLYDDALVAGFIKAGGSGTSATGYLNIFAYASVDGGTTYTDACTGSDAAHTDNLNLVFLCKVVMDANGETVKFGPLSIAQAFGGSLPPKWGIVVTNGSGGTLDSTGGNHEIHYVGVTYTST